MFNADSREIIFPAIFLLWNFFDIFLMFTTDSRLIIFPLYSFSYIGHFKYLDLFNI